MPKPSALGEPETVARQHAELQRSLARQIEASPLDPWIALTVMNGAGSQLKDSLRLIKGRLFGETWRTMAAKTRADLRAISAQAAQLPEIEVRVERTPAILKPADLLGRFHIKFLSLEANENLTISMHAWRIGDDDNQLKTSLSLQSHGWVSSFDFVKRAMSANFHSTYGMKFTHAYDMHCRAYLAESYFAHVITLSQRAHAILLDMVRDLNSPSSTVKVVFAVASDIPRFLPASEAPGPDDVRLWSLMPEFDIYLLENPDDRDSKTVERLTFREFQAEQNNPKGSQNARASQGMKGGANP